MNLVGSFLAHMGLMAVAGKAPEADLKHQRELLLTHLMDSESNHQRFGRTLCFPKNTSLQGFATKTLTCCLLQEQWICRMQLHWNWPINWERLNLTVSSGPWAL